MFGSRKSVALLILTSLLGINASAFADANLVSNGDFGTGNLTSWTVVSPNDNNNNQFSSFPMVLSQGQIPSVGEPPTNGSPYFAALLNNGTDTFNNPVMNSLTQSINVPTSGTYTLMFLAQYTGTGPNAPGSNGGSDQFSVSLGNYTYPIVDGPTVLPPLTFDADYHLLIFPNLSLNAGANNLSFSFFGNLAWFNITDVSLTSVVVPEPSTMLIGIVISALGGVYFYRRRTSAGRSL